MADWAEMDDAARRREIARRVAAGESLPAIAADFGVSLQAVRLRAPGAAVAPVTPEAAKRMVEGVGAALARAAVVSTIEAAAGAYAQAVGEAAGRVGLPAEAVAAQMGEALDGTLAPMREGQHVSCVALVVGGMTYAQAAEACGLTRNQVAGLVRRAGVVRAAAPDGSEAPPRRGHGAATPDADILAVVELWAEGRTGDEIAEKLGISRRLVVWRLRLADERGLKAAAAQRRAAAGARIRPPDAAIEARMAEVVRRVNAGQSNAWITAETGFDDVAIQASIRSAIVRHIPVARREPTRAVRDSSNHPAVALMRAGKSNAEVAAALGLTVGQVAGLRDRAVRKGQVTPGPRVTRRPAPSRPAPRDAAETAAEPAAKGLTEAEVAAVAAVWNEGKSYDEIGAALGLTSNQVQYRMTAARRAGLVLRAAWPATREQAAAGRAPREPGRKPPSPPPAPRGLPEIVAPIPVALAEDAPAEPGRYTVLDPMGGRCRWVTDVLAQPGRHGLRHMMCGERVDRPGSSWCPNHHRLAWRRVPLPSEDAAARLGRRALA